MRKAGEKSTRRCVATVLFRPRCAHGRATGASAANDSNVYYHGGSSNSSCGGTGAWLRAAAVPLRLAARVRTGGGLPGWRCLRAHGGRPRVRAAAGGRRASLSRHPVRGGSDQRVALAGTRAAPALGPQPVGQRLRPQRHHVRIAVRSVRARVADARRLAELPVATRHIFRRLCASPTTPATCSLEGRPIAV
jgi:hypothetical protein